ncbi:putative bifunctional chitinase/lysozyme [Gottschalkia purinilytica]|uniref:chitinase n=1 Tax=Gottschalkia purinilytica TaxID=1503 RepID=A0A0L0WA05_GOTPU|nr:glycosyl hydrolase family 18 protein [Gottschalkia purinilytica]KNF08272.1 putative bifunctional chitinase/lysozyme [Gottschalkia purinilytica]
MRKKIRLTSILMAVIFSFISVFGTTSTNFVEATGDGSSTGSKKVVAYFPNWGTYNSAHQSFEVKDIPWDRVTHINHAFFTIDRNFKLTSLDTYADYEKQFAHSEGWGKLSGHMGEYKYYKNVYPNVKVLISVGGWTRGENFHDMAKTKETRKVFIDSAIQFLKQYPFMDGIDLDWEYPGVDRPRDTNDQYDRGCPGGPEDKENFTLLLKEMREAYNANGLKNKLLTIAAPSGYDKLQYQEPDKYHQYLDFINVMTYDMHGAWEKVTNHHSPLYQNPNDPSGTSPVNIKEKYNVDTAMKIFENEYNIPAEKLNVGTPFYSRGWSGIVKETGENGLFAKANGNHLGDWDDPANPYPGGQEPWFKLKKLETTSGWKKYRDPYAKAPYLYNESKGIMLTYEDEESLREKSNYVKENGYGGLIIWEISGDDKYSNFPMTTIAYKEMTSGKVDSVLKEGILSVDNSKNTGEYKLKVAIPRLNTANKFKLYENDKVIEEKSIQQESKEDQVFEFDFKKEKGTYIYKLETLDNKSSLISRDLKVEVTDPSSGGGNNGGEEDPNRLPLHSFVPYVDFTAWPLFDISQVEKTGANKYVLAFIVSEGGTKPVPRWGGFSEYNLNHQKDVINKLRAKDGEVMVSFGGANGTPLAVTASTPEQLKDIYAQVIDAYNLKYIDFDIEGSWVAHKESIERRSKALALLQKDEKYKDVKVWYTLPVLPTGLTNDGIEVVKSALKHGVKLEGVNVMTMEFGPYYVPSKLQPGELAKHSISAGENLVRNLKDAYKSVGITKTDEELWPMVGITPMVGQNFNKNEVFYQEDARILTKFAREKKIGLLSMWSINRDKEDPNGPWNPNPSHDFSGIAQKEYEFASIFKQFEEKDDGGVVIEPTLKAPNIDVLKGQKEGDYTINVKVPSNNKGNNVKIYENNKVVKEVNIEENKDVLQEVKYSVVGNKVGEYVYKAVLSDGLSSVESQTITVNVKEIDTSLPQWDPSKVYLGGERVIYNGLEYEAKYWTQGNNPEESDAWKLLSDVAVEWNKDKAYNGGDKVTYKGNTYEAKYWTKGNVPGESDVWILIK